MVHTNKVMRAFATFFCVLTLYAGTTLASIPPSEFVVKTMVSKRAGGPKALKIKSLVKDPATGGSLTVITLISLTSGKMRTRFHRPGGAGEPLQKESVFTYGSFISENEGQSPSLIPTLLYSNDVARVIRDLILAGIPVRTEEYLLTLEDELSRQGAEVSSMKRFLGKPQWIYGAVSPSKENLSRKTPSELWLEKDRFILSKLVSPQQNVGVEYRFESYGYSKDFPYPRRTQVMDMQTERTLLLEEVSEFSVLQAEPSELSLPSSARIGESELEPIEDETQRELIRSYVKNLR